MDVPTFYQMNTRLTLLGDVLLRAPIVPVLGTTAGSLVLLMSVITVYNLYYPGVFLFTMVGLQGK